MMGTNFGSGFLVWHLQGVFMLIIVLAIILGIVYVSRFFKKDELKKLIFWFLVVGLVGCILIFILNFSGLINLRGEDGRGFGWGMNNEENFKEMQEFFDNNGVEDIEKLRNEMMGLE